jgi:hemolysin type calcium-binding protein
MRALTPAFVAATALILTLPAGALAGRARTDELEGGTVAEYLGARGERNDVTATADLHHVTFHDAGAPVKAGGRCARIDEHTVRCPSDLFSGVFAGDRDDVVRAISRGGPYASVEIDGGDGDDRLYAGSAGSLVWGGSGDDLLRGSSAADRLIGEAGSDHLVGASGDDELVGDSLHLGAADGDRIEGGRGRDLVTYAGRRNPISVDLRRRRFQGEANENDTLTGVEDVVGGHASDRLIGNGHDNVLRGGGGDDLFRAGGGDDSLSLNRPRRGHSHRSAGSRVHCGRGTDVLRNVSSHTLAPPSCERVNTQSFTVASDVRRIGASELAVDVIQRAHFRRKPARCAVVELAGPYAADATERPRQMGIGTVRAPRGEPAAARIGLNEYGRELLASAKPVRILVSVGGEDRCGGRPRHRPPRGFTVPL